MKVLNLRCVHQHVFEGWFASEDDYQSQAAKILVECPMCGDTTITRLPTAPRLNVSKSRALAPASPAEKSSKPPAEGSTATVSPAQSVSLASPEEVAFQSLWLRTVRQLVERTDDVGERFAEEARRMHYGEIEERAIRGKASEEDTQALREEGIDILSLTVPAAAKGTLQ